MAGRSRSGLAVVIGAFAVIRFYTTVTGPFGAYLGYDLRHYTEAAIRWLKVGTPYLPSEVAGPFVYSPETFLHPPISLYLFTPFIAFPAILWWIFPIAAIVGTIVLWRPKAWTWPILALIALGRGRPGPSSSATATCGSRASSRSGCGGRGRDCWSSSSRRTCHSR